MKHGTFFWSCHIPKDNLKNMGAIGILPAKHHYFYGFQPEADDNGMEWVFEAEPSFETLIKFAYDKGIVEVSHKHYRAIARGRYPGIGNSSKLNHQISNLKFSKIWINSE